MIIASFVLVFNLTIIVITLIIQTRYDRLPLRHPSHKDDDKENGDIEERAKLLEDGKLSGAGNSPNMIPKSKEGANCGDCNTCSRSANICE